MFIATGQDVANVAESSAGIVYTEITPRARSLHLDHDPVADRRHPRRRHRAGDAARVPRDPGLLRPRQGATSSPRSSPAWRWPARSRWLRRSRRSTGCRATRSTGANRYGPWAMPPGGDGRRFAAAARHAAAGARPPDPPDADGTWPASSPGRLIASVRSTTAGVPRARRHALFGLRWMVAVLLRPFLAPSSGRCRSRCSCAGGSRCSAPPTSSSGRSSACARTSCRRRSPTS